jgi:hypothetical protein
MDPQTALVLMLAKAAAGASLNLTDLTNLIAELEALQPSSVPPSVPTDTGGAG